MNRAPSLTSVMRSLSLATVEREIREQFAKPNDKHMSNETPYITRMEVGRRGNAYVLVTEGEYGETGHELDAETLDEARAEAADWIGVDVREINIDPRCCAEVLDMHGLPEESHK